MVTPIVKLDWLSGTGETAEWGWTDETGTFQGSQAGYALGATASYTTGPGSSDPLTQLVQQAVTHADNNGCALIVTGKSYAANNNGESPFLNLFAPLMFGACGDTFIELRNVIMLLRPSAGGSGIIFNSDELIRFRNIGGEILYRGGSSPILVQPQTRTTNIDNNLSINTSDIDLGSVTVQPQNQCGMTPAVIEISPLDGPVGTTRLRCDQIAGGGLATYGILNDDPVSDDWTASSIHHMTYEFGYVFGTTGAAIKNGKTGAIQGNLFANTWRGKWIMPGSAQHAAFDSFGTADRIEIDQVWNPSPGPSCSYAFVFEAGANYNRYSYTSVIGAAIANVSDNGTGNVQY